MEESKTSPDQIIEELGGCGRYQIRMNVIVHVMKTLVCWSVNAMVIVSVIPNWSCDNNIHDAILTNVSSTNFLTNVSLTKSCTIKNNTKCAKFQFDSGMKTIVSEFNLVCSRDYIPSTIMSIQIAGEMVGNLMAGHLADLIGRKPPIFVSVMLLTAANFAGYLSVNWFMFAVCRFFIGIGSSFFFTIQNSLLSEFSLSKWRTWVIGFPSWQLEACLFALLAWLIPDWRYITLMCSLFGVPCLFAWWFIPESFRWYISHDRTRDAEKVLKKVAEFNRVGDSVRTQHILGATETTKNDKKKYTILDLFKSRYLIRVTLLSALSWFGLGMVDFGIYFGMQALSGNIYLNFFLYNLTVIPTKALAIWLQNRLGRQKAAMLCFGLTAICSLVVGAVQFIDTDLRNELTNVFAIVANMGIQTALAPVRTMAVELYPTVIRTIAFGSLSVIGRLGKIVGTQLVYLNSYFPGLLYFACGGMAILNVIGLTGLQETANANLSDKIKLKVKTDKQTHANAE